MSSSSSSTQLTVEGPDSKVQALRALYRERKDAIRKRLSEFREVMKWSDEDVFGELAFCLLTPQSSAKVCWDAVTKMKQETLLLKGRPAELGPVLSQVRFGGTKAPSSTTSLPDTHSMF